MNNYDKYWLFVRKYLFSILLILAGLTFMIMGFGKNTTTNLSQSNNFLIGAIALFLLGFVSLYFILATKSSRIVAIIASVVFLGLSILFIQMNIQSVKDRIIYLKEVKESKDLAKQGLSDIKKLEEVYDRKYKKYAPSFEELTRFAKYDSVSVLVRAEGDLPTEKMTVAQAKELGHKYPVIWTEKDALKLNLIIREYNDLPVSEDLFGKETTENSNRKYNFEVDKIDKLRTIDESNKTFSFKTGVVDSVTTVLIQAIPPYGPQKEYDIKGDTLQVGSLTEKSIKSNWK